MDIDVENIEKIKKFVLYYYVPKKKPVNKSYWLSRGYLFCFTTVICFVMAFVILAGIENINIYPFYWSLLLIPIIAILSIKICKNTINKADYKHKPYQAVLISVGPFVGVIIMWFVQQSLTPDAYSTLVGVMVLFGGGLSVYYAYSFFYRVYLIRKYAPYFKDERLLEPTE